LITPLATDIDWAGYEHACRDYEERWRLLDQTLYDLCTANPGHASIAAVVAKLWIIGRTYATGIERRVAGETGVQGGALGKVAIHLHRHGDQVDEIIASLAGSNEPLDETKLATIVAAHGRFVRLLRPITQAGRSPRSFASKYLHFHSPAAPIYDSYVVARLQRLYARQKVAPTYLTAEADTDYAWFASRFWRLYQEARASNVRVSAKLLDHYLLWAA
jgi:hypothetical protein